jgi:hypothetical protein
MLSRVRVLPALLEIFVVPAMAFAWLSGSAWGQDVRPVLPAEPAPAAITVPSRWTCTDAETPAPLPASAPVPAEYRSTNRFGSGWDIERTDNTARLRFLTYDERGRPVWYVSSTGLFSPETQTWSGGLYREDLTPNGVRQVLVGSAAAQWIPEHPERVALRWRMGEVGANEEEECLWRTSASPMERGRWTLEHTTPVDVIELRTVTESRLTVLTHDQNGAPVWTTGTRASPTVPALQRYHRGIYRGDAYGARCVESDCVTTRPAGQIVGQFSDTRQPSANVRLEAVGVGADQLVALAGRSQESSAPFSYRSS